MPCGLQHELLDFLKEKVITMEARNRNCCLLIDEVQLTPNCEYDKSLHNMVGYISPEFVTNTTQEFATHALVVMVKGVCSDYKQTVA